MEFTDPGRELLEPRIAAVELLNLLRPTVAIDRFIVFAALALHERPRWRDRLRDDDEQAAEAFGDEVRRFYLFFPMAAARVSTAFDWRGVHFPRGRRVLLDLYGTDRHPQLWGDAFTLVPQGGGNHAEHHRCAGEWVTIAVLRAAFRLLVARCATTSPEQDLRTELRRIPALPRSRFVISNVRSTL